MNLKKLAEDRAWSLVAMGAAALAGMAMRKALNQGWRMVQEEEPPENPVSRHVSWRQALAWTVATSVAVSVVQLVAQRAAAAGWHEVRGTYPAELD
jgi:hypothetical protein